MIQRSLTLLRNWSQYAERDWHDLPDQPGLGFYGTGYNAWGVQTNQKYLSAMAVLSAYGDRIDGVDVDHARRRAIAALRFSLWSHVSGPGAGADGGKWGHTWISALGVERMMHGVRLLEAHLTDQDRDNLRNMLLSESDWLLNDYTKSGHSGIVGAMWNNTGKNVPESNLWNGAILWRTAGMYPDHEHAGVWREHGQRFMMNGVSIPADADDDTVVAGKKVRDWHAGPNFFPHYALDHHAYLNVGYIVICVSNAAMLHFDLAAAGIESTDALHHHQADLWRVLRKMVFGDGRLARIGGDTRLRYAYCQDYLMPALIYAADHLKDEHALALLNHQLDWTQTEAKHNNDGSFFSGRLTDYLARMSPYYTTRLESDRANVLGMVVTYLDAMQADMPVKQPAVTFEQSVEGGWCEPEHGAVIHRCPTRFASFAWRAIGAAQGLCLPPGEGNLAEWEQNLSGSVRMMGAGGDTVAGQTPVRQRAGHTLDTFEGGFVTCGRLLEGAEVVVAEGWNRKDPQATHHLAFAALPDGHTVVGLQLLRCRDLRAYSLELKGMLLNIPNDLFNGFNRTLTTATGENPLPCPPPREEVLDLDSRWANIDQKIGAAVLYGAPGLQMHRLPERRGGKFHSLHVDQLCAGCSVHPTAHEAGSIMLDVGWIVAASVDADQTRALADANTAAVIPGLPDNVRGVRVIGVDGKTYSVIANFGDQPVTVVHENQSIPLAVDQAVVRM